jgi:two-component system OmpR family sensor kinase
VIYLLSTFLLFSLASWVFYSSAKHNLLDRQRETLNYEAEYLKSKLRTLHKSDAKKLIYPKSKIVESAIYDLDKRYIFGTTKEALDSKKDDNKLYHVLNIEPYYLGAAYLKVSKDIDFAPIKELQKNIILFMLVAGIFFSILGYYLGKLFIAPMRESMKQLNHFIQDTTHELNTPISTILTNIEMIEAFEKHKGIKQELKRIEIASKTLSRIYDDLTYINLNHEYHREIVPLNISSLIKERILYFTALADAKMIEIETNIKKNVIINIDKNDALRLIDNLISNAIKYNKTYGKIFIKVNQNQFLVQDSGVGIDKNDMSQITKRFKRANSSEGGFGIG